jgi:hypothetical protein
VQNHQCRYYKIHVALSLSNGEIRPLPETNTSQSLNKNNNKNKNANIQVGRLNKQQNINNISLNTDNFNESSNDGWTHLPNKRNLSDSSEPRSPDHLVNKNKKLFITINHY